MNDLQEYVDRLFRHQPLTSETKELKEEILSNMIAKRDDLITQGMDTESAVKQAKESLPSVDYLIDGNQLTNIGKYRLECIQSVLLSSIIFWIFSLPLLFTIYAPVCYIGIILVVISSAIYLSRSKQATDDFAVLSITASKHRQKTAWILWAVFFLVATGMMAALTFGSDIWFGRPLKIDGPYQLATVAVRFYLPLLTIMIPITFSSFSKILVKNREEQNNE